MLKVVAICLFLTFSIFTGIPIDVIGDNSPDESENEDMTSIVYLYEHYSNHNHGSDCLLTWACDEEQEHVVEDALYFKVSTYGHKYDLQIKGSSFGHFDQWISSEVTTFIEIVYSISDNNETILVSESSSFLVGSSPINCDLDIEIPQEGFVINESHDLYLILEFDYPAILTNQITVYTGPEHTSGLSLTIKEPLRVELHISEGYATDDPKAKILFIFALFTTPFGGENIKDYNLRIDGPTEERDLLIAIANYPPSMGSRDCFWKYTKKNPKHGIYIIHLNATTRQGISGEDRYEFILDEQDNSPDQIQMWIFIFALAIAIILVGIILRERKMKES